MTESVTSLPYVEIDSRVDFRNVAEGYMGEGGLFVYDVDVLRGAAQSLLDIEMPYGMTVRYAAKANPHKRIVRQFDEMGLHFDASSAREAELLIDNGVPGHKISLSSQVLTRNEPLRALLEAGVKPVATSHRQIEMLGKMGCEQLAVRINPGKGYGHNNRTNVGGPASSFGIWHEELDEAIRLAGESGSMIERLHTHIGSGAEPDVWRSVIQKSLSIVRQLPEVDTLDIGGGFKVGRMPDEPTTNMVSVCRIFAEEVEAFEAETGRKVQLEIEPGTYLAANAGTLLGRVEETSRTNLYEFLKLNVGMNALLRPSMYGAQHPIEVMNDQEITKDYVVVGPCCESGDILTPAPGNPEGILPRELREASIGDIVAIGGAGAYGKTMAASEYNQVPPATEIFGTIQNKS